ncbi:gfo/Idh/MocA family oxidoreductase [Nakamurella sp. YIM 132087]|uniref:Gfo/Idh/MocA family oxidoreductase n=1 Tax=Nakamurella alba TaxID=2665158 RepID=A0A7K1FPZ9_9ACTN|nr:Gfo/Idh/MocA family oxidoreductase [Nakamurella alba]MTD16225.1 gfo/Idh/MocA family oxidoreductase [Nakamurella alba]
MPQQFSLPATTVPDPREAPALRWGILGTGWIAERFVAALLAATDQRVVAVGSRSAGSGKAFAAEHCPEARAHPSYEDLVADPDVDIVYVATPHNAHLPHAELAMRAGKHVLIEKPIAINAGQARRIAAIAAETGVYCAEAMWSFFLPKFDVIRQVLAAGVLGELRSFIADFGEHFDDDHRILRQDLAGGPMLDLGTYPVSLALSVLGVPDDVVARGTAAPSGVNGQVGMILRHGADRQSVVHTSLFSTTPTGAIIGGTDAVLTIPGVFYRPGSFRVDFHDGRAPLEYVEEPYGYHGLAYEAAETARRIVAGEVSTPVRPLRDSIDTLATMDEARRQIGAAFDEEK